MTAFRSATACALIVGALAWSWPTAQAQAPADPPVSDAILKARRYEAEAAKPPTKVVGSKPAKAGEDPWQVALLDAKATEPRRSAFCGGSIIAKQWVLTAAHCVDKGTTKADVDVLAGTIDTQKGDGVRLKVADIIIYGAYIAGKHDYDVALLRLEQDAGSAPIALIADNEVEPAKQVELRITGWGAMLEGGPMRDELRWVNVRYFDRNTCRSRPEYAQVSDRMICAGLAGGNADTCQGDSGGPMSGRVGQRRVLVGVTSWGKSCGKAEYPGIYARVASFTPWIASCVKGGPCYRL